jgi:PadR family transcriptional regulator, regulatory protein AphA
MSIKYAILGLLHYNDMHGYRIKGHLERNFGHMWSINYGQIYPNLKKMEEEGLVSRGEVVPGKGLPDRKLYSVTPAGREAFSRWLESSPERAMLLRDPFLLRFVFTGFGTRKRALELIDEQVDLYERQLGRRQENQKRWQSQGDFVRLTGELGVELNEMYLHWLKRAREEISEMPEKEFSVDPADMQAPTALTV